MCAMPRAPPPPSTSPMRGRLGFSVVHGDGTGEDGDGRTLDDMAGAAAGASTCGAAAAPSAVAASIAAISERRVTIDSPVRPA
jgi:hypothetical protein